MHIFGGMHLTTFEKTIISAGCPIVTWDHDIITDYLLSIFKRDYSELVLEAANDESRRKELVFVLDYDGMDVPVNFGGTVHYSKNKSKFTHITYSDRYNYAVQFSIESKVAFFSRDFYKSIKHIFSKGYSNKRLKEYLFSN